MISLSCQADLHVWCHFTTFVQYKCILWLRVFFEISFKRSVDYSQHPWVTVWLTPWICYQINESTRLPTLKKSGQRWCKRFYKIMYHNTHLLLLDTSWFYNKIKLHSDKCGIRFNLVLVARLAMINASDCRLMAEDNNFLCTKLKEQGSKSSDLPWPLVCISNNVSTRQARHFNNCVSTNIAISSLLVVSWEYFYYTISIWIILVMSI